MVPLIDWSAKLVTVTAMAGSCVAVTGTPVSETVSSSLIVTGSLSTETRTSPR